MTVKDDNNSLLIRKKKRERNLYIILAFAAAFMVGFISMVLYLTRDNFKAANYFLGKNPESEVKLSDDINIPTLGPEAIPSISSVPDVPTVADPNNFSKDYDYAQVAQNPGTVRVPVLTYHHLAPLPAKGSARDYYVSPQMFDQQMAYLKSKNYRTLSMQEFLDQLKSGENPKQKSVLITFDDGNSDNYTYAFPILEKYGFKATFFIVSSRSGITSAHLKEMAKAGMDIESHTKSHKDLIKITNDAVLTNEIAGSKPAIEYMSGSKVIALAYPGCTANSQTIQHVRSAGFSLAFTCSKKIDNSYRNRYTLNRVHIYSNIENFKQRLSGICNYTAAYE